MTLAEVPVSDPHAMKHLSSNPIAMAKVRLVIKKRNDLIRDLNALSVIVLFSRIDQERRGGISAGQVGESVSGSRTPARPQLDTRDAELDAIERNIEKQFQIMDAALREVQNIVKVMGNAHAPSKKERELAADIGQDCMDCARPVAATPKDPILAGMCKPCWNRWNEAGKPDKPAWLKQRQLKREAS